MPKINQIPEEHKMASVGLLSNAQKLFSMQELKNKGLSQYKIRNLVKVQSADPNRRFCGAKRTRCGASGLTSIIEI